MKVNLSYSIEIAKGLGDIKFGASREAVEQYIGPPDGIEVIDEAAIKTLTWSYTNLKLDVGFQEPIVRPNGVIRLISFATRSPSATLWGSSVIGRTKSEILSLFNRHGHGGFQQCEQRTDALGFEGIQMESIGVILLFRMELLRTVIWRSLKGVALEK